MEGQLWSGVIQGGVSTAALMALIIWLGKDGKVWVWARELHACEKAREQDKVSHTEELVRVEAAARQDREERMQWQGVALDALGVAEQVSQIRKT